MLWSILHPFWKLLSEALPLFLLGALLGAAAEAWLGGRWIERWVGDGHRSLPTIGMAVRVVGRAATLAYLGAWLVLAIGGGMLLDAVC